MIPWALTFFRSIPFWNKDLATFGKFSIHQAQKRVAKVSEKKDLFYHLVAIDFVLCFLPLRRYLLHQIKGGQYGH